MKPLNNLSINKEPIKQKLNWDLSALLGNNTLEELVDLYIAKQKEFLEIYELNPFTSKEKMIEFHSSELELNRINNRISNYISNHQNTDLSNTKWFLISQEIQSKSIFFCQKMSTFDDVVTENKDSILKIIDCPELKQYKQYYKEIFKYLEHNLESNIKRFCATYAQLTSSHYYVFTLLFEKEMQVQDAINKRGLNIPITSYTDFIKLQKDKDREVRKTSYVNWTNAVFNLRETYARLLFYNFLELNVNAKNKKFPGGYYEASMFADDIPLNFVNILFEKFALWKKYVYKYKIMNQKIIKHNYKLDTVQPWDLTLDINTTKVNYSTVQAQEIVCNALLILGTEYQEKLQNAFNNESIDWLPKQDKVSSAYCIGNCYGIDKKYILLNFKNTYEDVLTLGHELGHALHATYFSEKQTQFANTTIFLAEIPSTLNEILINYYMLEEAKKRKDLFAQLEIYDQLISSVLSTTSSQLVFSEWEYTVNQEILAGKAFSAKIAEDIYLETRTKYLGLKKKRITKLGKKALAKILTVPHFYCGNFYVYKYAIGIIVSMVFSEQLRNPATNASAIQKLSDFLSSGDSKNNLETIKLLDIDLLEDAPYKKAEKLFRGWIQEYKKLFHALYGNKVNMKQRN